MSSSDPTGPRPETDAAPDRDGLRGLLRGNVGALASTSFLNDLSSEMIYPLLPVFLTGVLGAGAGFLGLVEGVAESAASLTKLAGGWLSDRLGRRKRLVAWGYGVAAATRPLLAVAAAPWHVLGLRLTDRLGKGVRTAPRDALLAGSAAESRRGAAFGLHRAADHAGAVLGPLVATGLLLLMPGRIRWVFALAAIPGAAAVLVVLLRVREVVPSAVETVVERSSGSSGGARAPAGRHGAHGEAAHGAGSSRERSPQGRAGLAAVAGSGPTAPTSLRDLGPSFPRYLAVLLLFTLGNASDAFILLRATELGVPTALVPLLWGALHVSKTAWSVPGGMLADRVRPSWVILAGWMVYALVYAGFAAAGAAWHVWALVLLYGLFYGLTESPEKALVAALAPDPLRARAFGAYHFAIGVGALPASLLFGGLWEAFGASAAFLVGAGLALVAALLLPLSLRGGTVRS